MAHKSTTGKNVMLEHLQSDHSQVAQIIYTQADFEVLRPGAYVLCAITNERIPLDELKYWNPVRQEAYVDAEASLEAERKAGTVA